LHASQLVDNLAYTESVRDIKTKLYYNPKTKEVRH